MSVILAFYLSMVAVCDGVKIAAWRDVPSNHNSFPHSWASFDSPSLHIFDSVILSTKSAGLEFTDFPLLRDK